MEFQRNDVTRVLREYATQLKERREEARAMLAELVETSPALATLAYLGMPAYHDDDGSIQASPDPIHEDDDVRAILLGHD